jgi:hypothetical protein
MADSTKAQLAKATARVSELELQLEAAGSEARRRELELQQLRSQLARPRLLPLPARAGMAPLPPPSAAADLVRPMDEPEAGADTPTDEAEEIRALKQRIARLNAARRPGR